VSGPRAQVLVTPPPTGTARCSTPARCCVLAQRRVHSRCNATDPRDAVGPSSAQPEGGRGGESTPASPFPISPEPGNWFKDNDAFIRAAPLYLGAAAILSLVANRVLSGEALATDASTAQSRAEVIVLALSTALVLTVRSGFGG
jgi:Cofactor assembly of complex C subunit B, CCB2/CCB4